MSTATTINLHDDMQRSSRDSKSNLLTINTSGLCLVCFKECHEDALSESETSIKFCRTLARYLNINFRNVLDGRMENGRVDVQVFLCLDCSTLAAQFLKNYEQFELYQMKLNFCAETLCKIMTSAEKIPSRVQQLCRRFQVQEQNMMDVTLKKVVPIDNKTATENLRKEIVSKCRLKIINSIPRVMIDSSLNTENRLVPYSARKDQEAALIMSLMGCIISFWLVLSLSFYNPDEWIEAFNVNRQREKEKRVSLPVKQKIAAPQKRARSPAQEIVTLDACPLANKCAKFSNSARKSGQPTENGVVMSALQTMKKKVSEVASQSHRVSTRTCHAVATEEEAFKAGTAIQLSTPVTVEETATSHAMLNPRNPETAVVLKQNCVVELVEMKSENLLPYDDIPDPHTTNVFTCHICHLQFDSRAKIQKHRAVIHKLSSYVQCPICNQMLRSYLHLQTHRAESLNGQCQISETMKKYELIDIARPLFPYSERIFGNNFCPYDDCYEVFESDELLKVHMRSHGDFQCNFCAASFGKAYDVTTHEVNMACFPSGTVVLASSPEAKLYKCTRCPFSHLIPEQFVTHFLQEHLHVSPFVEECSICHKGFLSTHAAKMHYATIHGITKRDPDASSEASPSKQEVDTECFQCNKTFGSPKGLRMHFQKSKAHQKPEQSRQLTVYSGRRKYPCELCDYHTSYGGNLIIHMISIHPLEHFADDLPFGTTLQKFNDVINSITSPCIKFRVDKRYLLCPFCSNRPRLEQNLRVHILMSHSEKVLEKFFIKARQEIKF